ncbi:MAG: hypothetical protein QOI02_1391 [Actinomycetota bacterium]|nr:hypothetical protein [Actinomycetota bacterium]
MSFPAEPPSTRPIIAFFDVDNTLMRGASLFHIAKAAFRQKLLTARDIARFTWQQAVFVTRGENLAHFSAIKAKGLELIAGHTENELRQIASEVFERDIQQRLWPETVALTREHLRKGHEVWLITAAPQIIAQVIAQRLGLTGALGTGMKAENGVFTGEFDGGMLHGEQKAVAARAFAEALNAGLEDCWAYSDSENDIPLLTLVGHRVVVNPDAALRRHAKALGWPSLELKRGSIREAQKRVRREARQAARRPQS